MRKGILGGSQGGPGQRKTGTLRILELLGENLVNYFRSGMIALVGGTLYGAAVWVSSVSRSILLTLLAGLAAGALLGPCLCGLTDTVLRSLRDMPGNWAETYRRAWRQNTRQSIPFGMAMGLILAGQIFALRFGLYPGLTVVSMVILCGVFLYVWPQIALVELRSMDVLRNAMVLTLSHPLKTVEIVLIAAAWALLIWLLLPLSAILWAIGGLWFSALLILYTLSDLLENTFHAEATLSAAPPRHPK